MKERVHIYLAKKVFAAALAVLVVLPLLSVTAFGLSLQSMYTGLSYASETVKNSANKNVNTYVAAVDLSGTLSLAAGVPNDSAPLQKGLRQTVSKQAQAARLNGKNVLAAVNGDFFSYETNVTAPQGLVVRDGELLKAYKSGTRIYFFGILDDGTAVIGNEADYKRLKDRLVQAVGGGDCLLKNGAVPYTYGGATAEPRTAVGIKADGSVLLVVADGRTTASAGMSLADMASYMKALGAVDVLNLDGGGSSTMVLKNPATRKIELQNKPSDGGERMVGNSLLVVDSNAIPWLDKLPDSLSGILKLPGFLQTVVYVLLFGWVFNFVKLGA